jgi:hypothetical protein
MYVSLCVSFSRQAQPPAKNDPQCQTKLILGRSRQAISPNKVLFRQHLDKRMTLRLQVSQIPPYWINNNAVVENGLAERTFVFLPLMLSLFAIGLPATICIYSDILLTLLYISYSV